MKYTASEMAKGTWGISATVPISQIGHFNDRSLMSARGGSATFFLKINTCDETEISANLGNYENSLEDEGIQNFSLEATPLRER